jgi:hypothetical protein
MSSRVTDFIIVQSADLPEIQNVNNNSSNNELGIIPGDNNAQSDSDLPGHVIAYPAIDENSYNTGTLAVSSILK